MCGENCAFVKSFFEKEGEPLAARKQCNQNNFIAYKPLRDVSLFPLPPHCRGFFIF